MKKTLICLLLALCLAALTACSSAPAPEPEAPEPEAPAQNETQEPAQSPAGFELAEGGVRFELPEALQNTKGVIQPCYGYEYGSGSGIYLSGLQYFAFPQEKYDELLAKQGDISEEERAFVNERAFDLIDIFALDGGRGLEALEEIVSSAGQKTSDYQLLGTAGEYRFFCCTCPNADWVKENIKFDEGFREDYDAVAAALDDLSWIQVFEPKKAGLAAEGSVVRFETTDLDGNPVSSEDIFSGNKLTMVNIWGTFCGPCINEMPDLEVLNGRLADKGCAIIGVVCDVAGPADTGHIGEAKEIIADTGVTYRNLLPWEGFDAALPAEYIPTTYFVDSEGKLVGEPAVGARGADDYEALLDAALASIG